MVEIAEQIREDICKSISQKAAGGRFIIYDHSTNLRIVIYDIELPTPAFGKISKGQMDLIIPMGIHIKAITTGVMTDWEIRSSIRNKLYPNRTILIGTIGKRGEIRRYDIEVDEVEVTKNKRLSIEQLTYVAPV